MGEYRYNSNDEKLNNIFACCNGCGRRCGSPNCHTGCEDYEAAKLAFNAERDARNAGKSLKWDDPLETAARARALKKAQTDTRRNRRHKS